MAVALGVFIGCLPIYGLHLTICWLIGYLLGLQIDYYVLVNLDGFKNINDAFGHAGVNGAPGYIAANAIVDDLKLQRTWTPVPPPEWRH